MYTIDDFVMGSTIECTTHGTVNGKMQHVGTVVGISFGDANPAHAGSAVYHTRIYPSLPEAVRESIEDNHNSYSYIVLKSEDGTLIWLGIPWIATFENSTTLVRTFAVLGSDELSSARIIQDLKLMGYKAVEVP